MGEPYNSARRNLVADEIEIALANMRSCAVVSLPRGSAIDLRPSKGYEIMRRIKAKEEVERLEWNTHRD